MSYLGHASHILRRSRKQQEQTALRKGPRMKSNCPPSLFPRNACGFQIDPLPKCNQQRKTKSEITRMFATYTDIISKRPQRAMRYPYLLSSYPTRLRI